MQKISTHLWFDTQAVEAADFYKTVFSDVVIKNKTTIHNTPSGDCDMVSLQIFDHDFMFISAGPLFKINPSVSFMIVCNTAEEVEKLWGLLAADGKAMMELGEYPFSKKYGWVQDKYGVSWQLMFYDGDTPQKLTPTLMFVGDVCGKAEEAINFWTEIFHGEIRGEISRYNEGEAPETPGTVRHMAFILENQEFAAMDSARMHDFGFSEAISFVVKCKDQAEIDYYWNKLSAVPESEQCGWLKDKYGFSWQIVPAVMDTMMQEGDQAAIDRITAVFLKMKKFNIAELQAAYEVK